MPRTGQFPDIPAGSGRDGGTGGMGGPAVSGRPATAAPVLRWINSSRGLHHPGSPTRSIQSPEPSAPAVRNIHVETLDR
jgi:hypothetical protein